jgi:2-amino-4-hydroxy-6-hydroxymethyldihydropteridine diphosphokinase
MAKATAKITTAYIGLGSNLADRAAFIKKALKNLDRIDGITVVAVSALIETRPLGDKNQDSFLNAVAKVETTLAAEQLHEQMALIEGSLGRQRRQKWSPRTIDLDLLLYGNEIIKSSHLVVPHTQMHLRSFVLQGMCELNADLHHPVLNRSMSLLLERLGGNDFALDAQKPQLICVAGVIGVGKTTLARGLAKMLDCEMLAEAYDTNPYLADVYDGKKELALDSQLYFLDSRVNQLKKNSLKAGCPVVTDYIFDKEMIYARRTLDADQLGRYKERYRRSADTVAKPVLVVYMTDSPEKCLDRIRLRNRPYEQKLKLPDIETLSRDYEQLFADWPCSSVIHLGANEFNCLDDADVKALANEIRCYIDTS